MKSPKRMFLVLFVLMAISQSAQAGFADFFDSLFGKSSDSKDNALSERSSTSQSLTQSEMTSGLLEALSVGVKRAIDTLGKQGGYLNDPKVRIPMPENLRSAEKLLRSLGQDKLADEFIETLNSAAEKAVLKTIDIFSNAIKKMTVDDARGILSGPDDSATKYFRKTASEDLTSAILPIVKQATDKTGVTSAYKKMLGQAVSYSGGLLDPESIDLDAYVTRMAMQGLFLKLAEQEKLIRKDPLARTTDILKKVFGNLK